MILLHFARLRRMCCRITARRSDEFPLYLIELIQVYVREERVKFLNRTKLPNANSTYTFIT